MKRIGLRRRFPRLSRLLRLLLIVGPILHDRWFRTLPPDERARFAQFVLDQQIRNQMYL